MGQLIALVSAMSYALSYCFLRKGQAQAAPPDFGLFPILIISAITLDGVFLTRYTLDPSVMEVGDAEWTALLWAGLSGIVATLFGRLLLYNAIDSLGATRGVILKGISPFATLFTALIALDHDPSLGDFLGLVAVLFSMGLLVAERVFHPFQNRAPRVFQNGVAIGILAAFLQGIGHAFRQLGMEEGFSPSIASAVDLTVACAMYIALLAVRGRLGRIWRWYVHNANGWLILAGLCSSAGVFCFFVATSYIPVATVAILVATEPLFVTLLSVAFFSELEKPSWWTGFAALTITASVILVTQ